MQTVDMMATACEAASRLGYAIRYEWLGGTGGGACEIRGQKWIFVDLALNTFEQLDQLCQALQQDHRWHALQLPAELSGRITRSRAA